jgi:hypothetical protein
MEAEELKKLGDDGRLTEALILEGIIAGGGSSKILPSAKTRVDNDNPPAKDVDFGYVEWLRNKRDWTTSIEPRTYSTSPTYRQYVREAPEKFQKYKEKMDKLAVTDKTIKEQDQMIAEIAEEDAKEKAKADKKKNPVSSKTPDEIDAQAKKDAWLKAKAEAKRLEAEKKAAAAAKTKLGENTFANAKETPGEYVDPASDYQEYPDCPPEQKLPDKPTLKVTFERTPKESYKLAETALDDLKKTGHMTDDIAFDLIRANAGMNPAAQSAVEASTGKKATKQMMGQSIVSGMAVLSKLPEAGGVLGGTPEMMSLSSMAGSPEVMQAAGIQMSADELGTAAKSLSPMLMSGANGATATAEEVTEAGVVAAQVAGAVGAEGVTAIVKGSGAAAKLSGSTLKGVIGGAAAIGGLGLVGGAIGGLAAKKHHDDNKKPEIKTAIEKHTSVQTVVAQQITGHITEVLEKTNFVTITTSLERATMTVTESTTQEASTLTVSASSAKSKASKTRSSSSQPTSSAAPETEDKDEDDQEMTPSETYSTVASATRSRKPTLILASSSSTDWVVYPYLEYTSPIEFLPSTFVTLAKPTTAALLADEHLRMDESLAPTTAIDREWNTPHSFSKPELAFITGVTYPTPSLAVVPDTSSLTSVSFAPDGFTISRFNLGQADTTSSTALSTPMRAWETEEESETKSVTLESSTKHPEATTTIMLPFPRQTLNTVPTGGWNSTRSAE